MHYTTLKAVILTFVLALAPFLSISAQEESTSTPVYTVAEAVEMINQGLTGQEVLVKGIVSKVLSTQVAADGWMTYEISDDGKRKSQQLRLIRNYKGIDNGKWTDLSEIGSKDNVIVSGKLDKAVANLDNTWSLEYGNYLVEHNRFSPVPMDCETVDFTDVYYGETYQRLNTYSGMSFRIIGEKGTNSTDAPKYLASDNSVHIYEKNTLLVESSTANLITRIEIAYVKNKLDISLGMKVSSGKASYKDNVLIWQMDEPVAEATLTAGKTSSFTSITVYYGDASDERVYTRDVSPGRVGTICLPCAVEAGNFSGARCYETDYADEDKVYFSEVTNLEAGIPYIFFVDKDAEKITAVYSGEPVDVASNRNGLYGTFKPMEISESDNIVVLSGNRLVLCGDNSSLAANRAYLKINEISALPTHTDGAKRVSFSLEGIPTGIEFIEENPYTSSPVYNITGQRVSPTSQGILIRNGRKYVNMPTFSHKQ